MDGDDRHVPGTLRPPYSSGQAVGDRVRRFVGEIHAGMIGCRGPRLRYTRGRHSNCEQHDPGADTGGHHRRPLRLRTVASGADGRQPGVAECVKGLDETAAAEIEHVVVRQHTRVGRARRQAWQVGRIHPVVHALARREIGAPGDAGLEVHHSNVGTDPVQNRQRISPRPVEVDRAADRPVHPLGQLDVGPSVTDGRFP